MDEALHQLDSLRRLTVGALINWIDILVVTFVIYRLLKLLVRGTMRGTRTWRIVLGLFSYVALLVVSARIGLKTISWLLEKGIILGPVALVILFLPEIRQALENFGKLWPSLGGTRSHAESRTIEEIVAAVTELAAANMGALIVIERATPLDEYVANGTNLNADVTPALLNAIFYEGNPLHDGAAIIKQDSIVAAACRLPLSESTRLDRRLHMRHRAGVGITESTDAVCVIVSEERGAISVAMEGRLKRLASHMELREILKRELRGEEQKARRTRRRSLIGRVNRSKNRKAPSEVTSP